MSFLNKIWSKNGIPFVIASIIIVIVSVLAMAVPKGFGDVITTSKNWFSQNLSTLFLVIPLIFLIILGFFVFSKWGKKKIGEGRPEYKTFTWLAMLFTAGVGVGTLTFGVAEPVFHASDNYLASGAIKIGDASTATKIVDATKAADAFQKAVALSIWDWGLPAMSIYSISGLVVAWFAFNKRYKSSFQPGSVIENGFGGKKVAKYFGSAANILAAITAVFTVAASLSIAGGNMTDSLKLTFFPSGFSSGVSKALPIIFICLISLVYILGSITPLKKGMAVLGDYTMYIGLAILGFVFLIGPSQFFVKQIVNGIGSMPASLANHGKTFAYNAVGEKWLMSWPITYILWWISWTPFMGVFLARISKGRTFRQYALASVVVPSIFMAIWFSVFGGFALKSLQYGNPSIFDKVAISGNVNGGFFKLMSNFPLFEVIGVITLIVFVTFVATTGISASVSVASIISRKGDEKPQKLSILIWAISILLIAIGLQFAGGGSAKSMNTMRDTAVLLGVPYLLVLIAQIVAMFKSMAEENQLIKDGKVKLFEETKKLPKFKMTKTSYFKNRNIIIISTLITGILHVLFATLILRGIFSGRPQWGDKGVRSFASNETWEVVLGISLIIMITLSFVLNNLIAKNHTDTKLLIALIISLLTLNFVAAYKINSLRKKSSEISEYNKDINIKRMPPVEYEMWLNKNKKI